MSIENYFCPFSGLCSAFHDANRLNNALRMYEESHGEQVRPRLGVPIVYGSNEEGFICTAQGVRDDLLDDSRLKPVMKNLREELESSPALVDCVILGLMTKNKTSPGL